MLILSSAAAYQPHTAALHSPVATAAGAPAVFLQRKAWASADTCNSLMACSAAAIAGGEQPLTSTAALESGCIAIQGSQQSSNSPVPAIAVVAESNTTAGGTREQEERHSKGSMERGYASRNARGSKTQFSSELLAFGQEVADGAVQKIAEAVQQGHAMSHAEQMQLLQLIEGQMRRQDPGAFGVAVNRSFVLSSKAVLPQKAPRIGRQTCGSAVRSAAATLAWRLENVDGIGSAICYADIEQVGHCARTRAVSVILVQKGQV